MYKLTQTDVWRLTDMANKALHSIKGEWNSPALAWAYALEVYLKQRGEAPGFTVELNPEEIVSDGDDDFNCG